MAMARNGPVELYYETFGSPEDPTLLLVNGFGSQCTNFADEWCELFAAEGYQVVRFDNRDTGLSSQLEGQAYSMIDMAADCVAVLDALAVDRAHVMGLSMGGAIVQQLAIDHPDRLLSMTSVMSATAEPGYGQSSPEALAVLTAPPATSRREYVDRHVAAQHVYGSKEEWLDDATARARAEAAYDRGFHPEGMRRQMHAIVGAPPRAEALRELDLPVLVLHGSNDRLIDPSGGRRTAELIPGARYEEIEGMGHDYPPAVWPIWVGRWADFARSVPPRFS
jgi:pimeloyl-ACP methyl ester carboxylesterase